MKNDTGFSLIELIIAMAVTTLVLGALYMAVNATQRHSGGIEGKVVAQQDAKAALNLMAVEIGMASYNPTFSPDLWVNPPGGAGACGDKSLNQNYRGIQEATPNALTVQTDISGNGALGDPNEMIRYVYDAANLRITRSTNCSGAQPFLGDTGGTRNVRVINNANNLAVFRYFDGSGTEIAAASLPAAIPDIRRIEITLAVETEHIDPNTGQRRDLIYTTSVIPRNHAIIP